MKCTLIANETGEILTDKYDVETLDDILNKQKALEIRKSKEEFAMLVADELGSFYFNQYKKVLDSGYEDNYIFRYLYLCTFSDYDGMLRYGNSKNNLVVKKDLYEMFNMSERENRNTINYLIENGLLIIIKDIYFRINTDICSRGTLSRKECKQSVRMFDDGIRNLYENSEAKDHKRLALFVRLLPYIHFGTNVLVKNPTEKDINLLEPFNMKELTNELGFSTQSLLTKNLFSIKVKGECAIGRFEKEYKKKLIVVNPKIYFKGNDINELKGLINLFAIK